MLSMKIAPFPGAVEVVDHQEAAAQQILAQLGRLCVRQIPVADLDGVQPWPIEDIVAVVEIDGLLDRARVDRGQPADHLGHVPVGARVVDRPAGAAVYATRCPSRSVRVHQTRERPFARRSGSPSAARSRSTRRRGIRETAAVPPTRCQQDISTLPRPPAEPWRPACFGAKCVASAGSKHSRREHSQVDQRPHYDCVFRGIAFPLGRSGYSWRPFSRRPFPPMKDLTQDSIVRNILAMAAPMAAGMLFPDAVLPRRSVFRWRHRRCGRRGRRRGRHADVRHHGAHAGARRRRRRADRAGGRPQGSRRRQPRVQPVACCSRLPARWRRSSAATRSRAAT